MQSRKSSPCSGPKDEYQLAAAGIRKWNDAFPIATVCIGNHDERVVRKATEAGIPRIMLRNYADIWKTPRWRWVEDLIVDDVYYFHGTGTSGVHPAYNSMVKRLMSVVQGHCHAASGVKWRASPQRRTFGMDTGCGIDDNALNFAYGKALAPRPVLSTGVVIDGVSHHHIMAIGPGEKYHRSRYSGRKASGLPVLILPEFRGFGNILLAREARQDGFGLDPNGATCQVPIPGTRSCLRHSRARFSVRIQRHYRLLG